MNSLPFGQLKSFLKILIGVQYEFAELGNIAFASWCLAIFLFPSNIVMLPPWLTVL